MSADDVPDYWRGVERYVSLPEESHRHVRTSRPHFRRRPRRAADRRLPALRRGEPGSRSSTASSSPARRGGPSATAPWGCPKTASWSTPCSARRWSTSTPARRPSPAAASPGVYDSDVRNRELEGEGIVAEVLFPDFQNSNEPPWGAAFPFPDTTPELRQAGARIFNRWLADFCGQLPGSAGRGGHRPAARHRRCRTRRALGHARPGLASVMLPTGDFELPSYHDTRYDPLWAACVETGLPVTFHSGGTPWEGYGSYAMWVTKFEFMWWARRPLWELILGGVFERFPDLRVAFTEQGADWIPSMLQRLDEQYASPFERGITDLLKLSPERLLGPQLLRRARRS